MDSNKTKAVIAVLIIGAGIFALVLFMKFQKQPPKVEVKNLGPIVSVMTVTEDDSPIIIEGYGTVRPEHSISVVPQVGGKVVWVSSDFVDGGFLKKGEILLKIEQSDYQFAVTRAEARVAKSRVALKKVEKQAATAKKNWEAVKKGFAGESDARPDDLAFYIPQVAAAKADFASAEADLAQARLNLARTVITAPFNCRVTTAQAYTGQFVTAAKQVGSIFSTDTAEVDVPLNDRTTALFDIPCAATVVSDFGGERQEYPGRVVRTRGQLDPATRMVGVTVIVKNPFGFDRPLENGGFVTVKISGRRIKSARLPVSAEHNGSAWTAKDGRLHIRPLEIIYRTEDFVRAVGLIGGEQVITSPLFAVTENMKIRVYGGSVK
ncbi:MAG: efflux RND transporter periplasmic adaptor subunit [Deltaproteobacteria bacterium]|nr:efflux RND transporter periplasmic adaptor subunit [Deltaproteobacteria bacterium]